MPEKIKLHFLGTSGAFPTAKRNHPAFLLSYKGENILVDCGEGTQRQFRKARLNPCKITRVLITHWHGDHVLGLPGLFQTLSLSLSEYEKTLCIYGPRGIKQHVADVLRAFPHLNEVILEVKEVSGKFFESEDFYLEAEGMEHGTPCNAYNFIEKSKLRIDKVKLKKLKIKPGKHLKDLKEGKDITYEGKKYKFKDLTFSSEERKVSFVMDTANNRKIVPFVKKADVLVMESTFDSSLEDLAREHKHMTVGQTAKIAKSAKVEKLFLVHVSDRYEASFPEILKDAKKTFKNVDIPGDLDSFEF